MHLQPKKNACGQAIDVAEEGVQLVLGPGNEAVEEPSISRCLSEVECFAPARFAPTEFARAVQSVAVLSRSPVRGTFVEYLRGLACAGTPEMHRLT